MPIALPHSFQLPQFSLPFTLSYPPNGDAIAADSDEWFKAIYGRLSETQLRNLYGLKAGILTGYCYPYTDDERLRIICDFMNILFHLDDLSDPLSLGDTKSFAAVIMNAFDSPLVYREHLPDGTVLPSTESAASKLCRNFWGRCIQQAGPGVQARFRKHMDHFFKAVKSEAKSREDGSLPRTDDYLVLRRDNSGCRPCFDLMEYALGIDLSSAVLENPIIQTLSDCANDYIALTNDLFSYNVEQARGDTYNLVTIIMKNHKTDLQGAIDHIAELSGQRVQNFLQAKAEVPLWDGETNQNVVNYIRGLEDWMAGTLYWSFLSKRYFGEKGEEVKRCGLVQLLHFDGGRPRANAA